MKFAETTFPKGTFTKQNTDGAYINEYLASNLDVYAKKIADDMHFTLIISGNDSVGNGKSTMASHVGSYLTWKSNMYNKEKNVFTHDHMVYKAKDLVTTSFRLPKNSVIVLDEGDDLTEHSMKDTAKELKKFFRKCRQLNQILILILPMFFELPRFYALGRSHCLINVKFKGEFDRGHFDFYGPNKKKELYLKGKRDWNYNIIRPDFSGRFFKDYCFFPDVAKETELYKKGKYEDMIEDGEEQLSVAVQLRNQKMNLLANARRLVPEVEAKRWYEVFNTSQTTTWEFFNKRKKSQESESKLIENHDSATTYNNITNSGGEKFPHSEQTTDSVVENTPHPEVIGDK